MMPPCPLWCVEHSDDFDDLAPVGERAARLHVGCETAMQYREPGSPQRSTVTVRLQRFDTGMTPGAVGVGVVVREEPLQADGGFLFDCAPMTVADAAQFAALLGAAAEVGAGR